MSKRAKKYCDSINHAACRGDLWKCAACGGSFCEAEGTDNDIELCDSCWAKKHMPGWAQ